MDERIGIVGGTGLYSLDGVEVEDSRLVETPFGRPSGPVVLASLGGAGLAFLARHGTGHVLSPSEVPYAANIYALKSVGVRRLVSVSAVGSMKERIAPRDFVVPDQLLDRTKGIRRSTFFGDGVVGHISFGEPYCPVMRRLLVRAAGAAGARVHDGGTYICMEGPAFSTRAESMVYRGMGMDIIGMTALPEAKLAREAGICYATLALVTDYDVWREATGEVTLEMVIANMNHNTALARATLRHAVEALSAESFDCSCRTASANAIITAPEHRCPSKSRDLGVVLG